MNKNKYFDRYQNLNLSKETLNMMWLTYLREHRVYAAQLVPMGGTAQESAQSVPTVVTVDLDASGFTPSATAYGNVTSSGGAEVTERGFRKEVVLV